MLLSRSFQVNDLVLDTLTREGFAPDFITALRRIKNRKFYSKKDFLKALVELSPQPHSPGERDMVLKHSRLGYLGLERILPHRAVREWVEALIFALIIASIVRTFLFAPFKIPSGSMIPTIAIGDHIFATMYSFGVPIPFTDIKIFRQPVERGDIIIFPYPLDPSVDYIKRVIGLEGERVALRDGKVLIDRKQLDEPYAYFDEQIVAEYTRQDRSMPDFGPVRVPEGNVFVMGDNRLRSSDSRIWGFVPISSVKGKGQIVYWSHDAGKGWFGGYHIGRIGTLLE